MRDPADAESWREFETRYVDLIRRFCTRRGLAAPDIDDVCQIVWSNLAKGLRSFSYDPAKGRFRGYLYRVVRNAIARQFNHLRKDDAWLAENQLLAEIVGDSESTDEVWEREWTDHHIRLALSTIERTFEPQSVAVFQRLLAGDSADQVATGFNMSVAAVNQAKHRIRERMTTLIALQVREEDDPDGFRRSEPDAGQEPARPDFPNSCDRPL